MFYRDRAKEKTKKEIELEKKRYHKVICPVWNDLIADEELIIEKTGELPKQLCFMQKISWKPLRLPQVEFFSHTKRNFY
jgi:hypothetical protein